MAAITLYNPRNAVQAFDESGTLILKSELPSVTTQRTLYKDEMLRPSKRSQFPRLGSFCIRALLDYTDQLHVLGNIRLRYSSSFARRKDGKRITRFDMLKSLFCNWGTPNFSLAEVDPRLWANIIQIYEDLPEELRTLPIQLSDPHLPFLQHVPSTPNFALITVLDLRRNRNLADESIIALKALHNLAALDVSFTDLSTRGLRLLSRTLIFNDVGERRGPWGLRILRMRGCYEIDNGIFRFIKDFPLLCVVDASQTRCSTKAAHTALPFVLLHRSIFKTTLEETVQAFSKRVKNLFSHSTPYILAAQDGPIQERLWIERQRELEELVQKPFHSSAHNSFVVLPPSRGSTSSRTEIQLGNADTLERERHRKEELERERERNRDWEPEAVDYGDITDEGFDPWKGPEDFPSDSEAGDSRRYIGFEGFGEYTDSEDSGEYTDSENSEGRTDTEGSGEHTDSEDSSRDDELLSSPSRLSTGPDGPLQDHLEHTATPAPPGRETSPLRLSVNPDAPLQDPLERVATPISSDRQTLAQVPSGIFYATRPVQLSPIRPINATSRGTDFILYRIPPPWSLLDSLKPETRTTSKTVNKQPEVLKVSHNQKASVKDWHLALASRRKAPAPGSLSRPPSPTLTSADPCHRQTRCLRPLSPTLVPKNLISGRNSVARPEGGTPLRPVSSTSQTTEKKPQASKRPRLKLEPGDHNPFASRNNPGRSVFGFKQPHEDLSRDVDGMSEGEVGRAASRRSTTIQSLYGRKSGTSANSSKAGEKRACLKPRSNAEHVNKKSTNLTHVGKPKGRQAFDWEGWSNKH